MKVLLWIILFFNAGVSFSQKTAAEINRLRESHLLELLDSTNSILTSEERSHFVGVDYYPFDENYQIEGTFKKSRGRKFEMPTSTERKAIYRRYGYLEFTFEDQLYRLTVYQNVASKRKTTYEGDLFIPFRDATSSNETYGGGRYLDLKIPSSSNVIIDFNLAYNPYRAYSPRYSCPIPPEENTLPIPIRAGEKYLNSH